MPRANDEGDSFIALLRETADGLGRLVAEHIRLARVEMVADAKDYSRRVGLMAAAGGVILIGYFFAWIATALALGRVIGAPLAFLLVGGLHIGGGAAIMVALARRQREARVMDQTVSEVGRTVTALRGGVNGGTTTAPEGGPPPGVP